MNSATNVALLVSCKISVFLIDFFFVLINWCYCCLFSFLFASFQFCFCNFLLVNPPIFAPLIENGKLCSKRVGGEDERLRCCGWTDVSLDLAADVRLQRRRQRRRAGKSCTPYNLCNFLHSKLNDIIIIITP